MHRRLLKFLLALSFAVVGSGHAQAAPIATDTFGSSTYELYYVAAGIDWDTANGLAIADGGQLAVLETAAENTFLAAFVALNPTLYSPSVGLGPWLGGFASVATGGVFQWVNAAPFGNFGPPWQAGQPDTFEGLPQGLLYYNGGATSGSNWGDYGQGCGTPATACAAGPVVGYVVEKTAVPEPASLLLLGTGLAAAAVRRRLVKRT